MNFYINRERAGLTQINYHVSGSINTYIMQRGLLSHKAVVNGKDFTFNYGKGMLKRTKINNIKITTVSNFTIDNQDIAVTYCVEKIGKGLFANEAFFGIEYHGRSYRCYEVGMGMDGIYYCIYRDGQIVAMSIREPQRVQRQTSYTCYAYNDIPVEVILAFTLHADHQRSSQNDGNVILFASKRMKAKYDPSFINKVLSEDRFQN